MWLKNQRQVPITTLGMATGDPADAMFNTTNFPGASTTDLTNARNLYAVLTGRVDQITSEARIGEDGETYNILGESLQKGRMWQLGFFLQDGWRWKPNLTINAGLRYEVQLPFYALNNSYSFGDHRGRLRADRHGQRPGRRAPRSTGLGNLFKPGALQGTPTQYKMLTKGTKRLQHRLEQLRAEHRRGLDDRRRDDGLLHTIFGSPGDWSSAAASTSRSSAAA